MTNGTRRGWGVSVTPRPLFNLGKDPVPIVRKAGWAPGPVWTGAKNLASTGIPSPDRWARSQSLYRLSYPDPLTPCIFYSRFFKPFVTVPVAPIINGVIMHFMFHISCNSIHEMLYFSFFCFLLRDISVRRYCQICQYACLIFWF